MVSYSLSYGENNYTFWLITIPLILIIISGFIALKTLKPLLENKNIFKEITGRYKILYSIYLVVSTALIGLVILFILSTFNDNPPQFFPFDDSAAVYTVIKEDSRYFLKYDSISNKNVSIDCSFGQNNQQICQSRVNHHEKILVGKSPVELENLLNKPLKVNGKFVYGTKQCIVSKCTDVGNYALVDITAIEVINW